jgi:predicted RNA binding protein YcfA (HicA-like mRNA interferase family)
MPLRNSFKYKDVVKVLEHFGCKFSGEGKGSHEGRESGITGKHFLVPNHGAKEIREGTLMSIFKSAEISKEQVIAYLQKKEVKKTKNPASQLI